MTAVAVMHRILQQRLRCEQTQHRQQQARIRMAREGGVLVADDSLLRTAFEHLAQSRRCRAMDVPVGAAAAARRWHWAADMGEALLGRLRDGHLRVPVLPAGRTEGGCRGRPGEPFVKSHGTSLDSPDAGSVRLCRLHPSWWTPYDRDPQWILRLQPYKYMRRLHTGGKGTAGAEEKPYGAVGAGWAEQLYVGRLRRV